MNYISSLRTYYQRYGDLLNQNSTIEDQIAVLDGDQFGKNYLKNVNNLIFLPFENIELELYRSFKAGELRISGLNEITNRKETDKAKNLYKQLTKSRFKQSPLKSEQDIYAYLQQINPDGVQKFKEDLRKFLSIEFGQ